MIEEWSDSTTMMKAWTQYGWISVSREGYQPDDDGYCKCFTCQYQKELQKIKVPEELFEL